MTRNATPTYISSEGLYGIELLGLTSNPKPHGKASAKLLATLASDECGCPEELWIVDGIEALIHFEPNGDGEITTYQWDEPEWRIVKVSSINQLRAHMFIMIDDILQRGEG